MNLIIILVNVICFAVFSILLSLNILTWDNIALSVQGIEAGKIWTLLTSMFMHTGLLHLFVNMFSLIFVGSLIEKLIGKKRYLYFYLISGLFAGVVFILSELIIKSGLPAVGASGAIFGLIGLLMFLTPNLPVYIMFIPVPIKMKYAAPLMLVGLWLVSVFGNIPIGNTAHLGGFILGLAYGLFLVKKYKNKTKYIRKYFS